MWESRQTMKTQKQGSAWSEDSGKRNDIVGREI